MRVNNTILKCLKIRVKTLGQWPLEWSVSMSAWKSMNYCHIYHRNYTTHYLGGFCPKSSVKKNGILQDSDRRVQKLLNQEIFRSISSLTLWAEVIYSLQSMDLFSLSGHIKQRLHSLVFLIPGSGHSMPHKYMKII